MSNPSTPPGSAKPSKPSPTPSSAAAFAAAVLARGGEIHRLPDGAGGHYEIAVLLPKAQRPTAGGKN